jgi:hypothetical protein
MSKWLPAYLRWYRFAYGRRMTTGQLNAWRTKRGHLTRSQDTIAPGQNTTG